MGRRVTLEDLLGDVYVRLGQSYGVAGDPGEIHFAEWHYSSKRDEIGGGERTRQQDRVSAAFDAICKGEIEIPAPLSPFFALEPYLAP